MKPFCLAFCGVLLLSSCAVNRNTFIAPLPNTPMFEAGGEACVNIAASPTHIEAQGAFSVTKNIGVTAGRFSGMNNRSSSELGLNLYTRIYKPLHFACTFGWGNTAINSSYTANRLYEQKNYRVSVGYQSLFVQPSLYLLVNDDDETLTRIGISVKYATNRLSQYYFREFENVFHSSNLVDETIITAQKQSFACTTPLISVEKQKGNFTVGGHFGMAFTSAIQARYQYNHTNTSSLNKDYARRQNFYYLPFIMSMYIGLRI